MRQARVLIPLLLLATVLVDLVVVPQAARWLRFGGPTPLSLAVLSLPMSQVCLLAAWAALGRSPAPWRAVGLILPLALWSFAIGVLRERPDQEVQFSPSVITSQWTFLLLLETAGAVALLGIARAAGLHVTSAADRAPSENAPRARPFQFSILYLLGWLTAVAIVLAGLGYTFSLSQLDLSAGTLHEMAAVTAVNVGALLAGLYATLGVRRWLLRWLVALATIALGAAIAWLAIHFKPLGAILFGCTAAWILASLAVVRVAGYRLAWRGKARAAPSPGRAVG